MFHPVFYDGLRVAPEEVGGVLLVLPNLSSPEERERAAEIMFEVFAIKSSFAESQAQLALKGAEDPSTCCVVVLGDAVSRAVPMYQAEVPWRGAISVLKIGDHYLTASLARATVGAERQRSGGPLLTYLTWQIRWTREATPRDMKEKLELFVAEDLKVAAAAATADPLSVEKTYLLPDGGSVVVGAEHFRCPDALYRPSIRQRRLHICGASDLQQMWRSAEEYQEGGASAVHRKLNSW